MICTSYFSNVKRLAGLKPRMVFVSIAGKTPDWFDGSVIRIEKYGRLAPKWSWWSEWKRLFEGRFDSDESKAWYSEKYAATVLSGITPKRVYDELMELSGRNDVCLLCWESPEKFCHRHIVGKWLSGGGIPCAEAENGKGTR